SWAGALSLTLTIAGAQEPPPSEDEPPATAEERVEPPPGAVRVTLAQAVSAALKKNFALLTAADSVQTSRVNYSATRAQFYPQVTPRYQHTQEDSTFGVDASQRLPWTGGSLTATTLFRALPGTDIGLTRSSGLQLVFNQPLLRGFGPNATY